MSCLDPDQDKTDKSQSIEDHKLNICHISGKIIPGKSHNTLAIQLDTLYSVALSGIINNSCLHCSADHFARRHHRDLGHIRCFGRGRGRGHCQVLQSLRDMEQELMTLLKLQVPAGLQWRGRQHQPHVRRGELHPRHGRGHRGHGEVRGWGDRPRGAAGGQHDHRQQHLPSAHR